MVRKQKILHNVENKVSSSEQVEFGGLSSSDVCRTILTDIALSCSQGTGRSQLDVQKFQEGICASRALEK